MNAKNLKIYRCLSFIVLLLAINTFSGATIHTTDNYEALVTLFKEWREFERPPMLDGAPDYTEKTFAKRYESFKKYRHRLDEIDHFTPIKSTQHGQFH